MSIINFYPEKIDRTLPYISISKCLELIQPEFDREAIATLTYNKHHDNPNSEYYGYTISDIIAAWEEKAENSKHYGRMLDDYIGINLTSTNKDNELKLWRLDNSYDYDDRLKNVCKSFDDFYNLMMKSGDMEFIDREKTVYKTIEVDNPNYDENDLGSPKTIRYNIRGRFDALFRNKRTGKYIIIDWKSSGEIETKTMPFTKKLLGPLFKFPKLNWYTYTLQLYFYKSTLVENYLPEGTSLDDVEVLIIQLPGKIVESSGQMFAIYKPAFVYDETIMNNFFNFCIQKTIIVSN